MLDNILRMVFAMKNFLVFFWVICFVYPSISHSKDFDFSLLGGFEIGMPKTKVVSLLEEKDIYFEEQNNISGGKCIVFIPNFTILGTVTTKFIIPIFEGKAYAISIYFEQDDDILTFGRELYNTANCKLYDEETRVHYFIFNNCSACLTLEDNRFMFIEPTDKNCKE